MDDFYIAFIDDLRDPKGNFDVILRSTESAIEYMERNGCPGFISFDFDLGGDDRAINIVKWMIDKDLDTDGEFIPDDFGYNIHSANPVGSDMLNSYLKGYLRHKRKCRR